MLQRTVLLAVLSPGFKLAYSVSGESVLFGSDAAAFGPDMGWELVAWIATKNGRATLASQASDGPLSLEASMSSPTPSPLLRPALIVFGLVFIFGILVLNRLWPSGWAWQPEQPAYLHMILGIYATLGVFLLLAARDPLQHLSLIWFTVWSSVVHAGVMALHSFSDPGQMGHLWGDVAALLLTAAVLATLTPRRLTP